MRLSNLILLSNLIFLFVILIQLHSTGNGGVEANPAFGIPGDGMLLRRKRDDDDAGGGGGDDNDNAGGGGGDDNAGGGGGDDNAEGGGGAEEGEKKEGDEEGEKKEEDDGEEKKKGGKKGGKAGGKKKANKSESEEAAGGDAEADEDSESKHKKPKHDEEEGSGHKKPKDDEEEGEGPRGHDRGEGRPSENHPPTHHESGEDDPACFDVEDSEYCRRRRDEGKCMRPLEYIHSYEKCRKTCKMCAKEKNHDPCKDHALNCGHMRVLCSSKNRVQVDFMVANCAGTCGVCGPPPPLEPACQDTGTNCDEVSHYCYDPGMRTAMVRDCAETCKACTDHIALYGTAAAAA